MRFYYFNERNILFRNEKILEVYTNPIECFLNSENMYDIHYKLFSNDIYIIDIDDEYIIDKKIINENIFKINYNISKYSIRIKDENNNYLCNRIRYIDRSYFKFMNFYTFVKDSYENSFELLEFFNMIETASLLSYDKIIEFYSKSLILGRIS